MAAYGGSCMLANYSLDAKTMSATCKLRCANASRHVFAFTLECYIEEVKR